MILGLGIDICPIERIEAAIQRSGDVFTERIFTKAELQYAGNGIVKGERLAARWAAKEASIKALNAPPKLGFHDMEVVNAENGAPSMIYRGIAQQQCERLGVTNTLLSISHAGGMAVAVVILEGDKV